MMNYDALMIVLSDMEKVAKALEVEPFSIYFMGGSACIFFPSKKEAFKKNLPIFMEKYRV